jgi:hypothetical protein
MKNQSNESSHLKLILDIDRILFTSTSQIQIGVTAMTKYQPKDENDRIIDECHVMLQYEALECSWIIYISSDARTDNC